MRTAQPLWVLRDGAARLLRMRYFIDDIKKNLILRSAPQERVSKDAPRRPRLPPERVTGSERTYLPDPDACAARVRAEAAFSDSPNTS